MPSKIRGNMVESFGRRRMNTLSHVAHSHNLSRVEMSQNTLPFLKFLLFLCHGSLRIRANLYSWLREQHSALYWSSQGFVVGA